MTDSKLHYQLESIKIIKQIIIDTKNKSDIEQQLSIRGGYPWHLSNLVAIKIYEAETRRLRNEFYKHKKFL